MRILTVGKNDADQRLDKFMSKTFRTMPRSMLYKYLRLKCVRVNGVHAAADTVLHLGDELKFYISDEYFGAEKPVDLSTVRPDFSVVYEDANLLIVDKPAGLICQPDEREERNTLVHHVLAYLAAKGEYDPASENAFAPALCNRIDKNTQGLVLASKNAEALRIMNEKIKNREITKVYRCLVFGYPEPRTGEWHDWLRKNPQTNTVQVFSAPCAGAKEIGTAYRVLRTGDGFSLVEVTLLTGRTHQIRAHFAFKGYPLVGDTKYGHLRDNRGLGFRYQALASCKVTFDFSSDAGCLSYLTGKTFETAPFFENCDLLKRMHG